MHVIGYIVLGLAAVMLSFQTYAWWDAQRARGRRVPTGEAAPDLNIPDTGLLYFFSPSCGACRPMTPIIEALGAERDDILAIDARAHPDIARAYRIRGTPTLVRLEHGKIAEIALGARGPKQIQALLDEA